MMNSSAKDQKISVGKYFTYPNKTGQRIEEGGLRLAGRRKQASADNPLVTVITVCFNSARTIEQAIQSVINQTYNNIEYIVIDGGSTDSTLEILFKYTQQIDYFLSESDDGLYFAMNKGLELANGNYIIFLNSDDWYELECVETLVSALKSDDVDFVSALANYVDEAGKFVRLQPPSPLDAGVDFRMPLRHETMLIPSDLYNSIEWYDTRYRINADRDFTARLFHSGYTHRLVSKTLLNFRISGVSSVNLNELFAERERMLRERFVGLGPAALRDLTDLERITPQRLQQIVRSYRMPHLRSAAIAYALDREAQGHKTWQDIDVDSFSPALKPRSVTEICSAKYRREVVKPPVPQVSVILPIYNAEKTLKTCIESILSQTLTDFELICVNDQSSDGSQAIVNDYAIREKRIKSIVNELNIGLGATRNRGIEVSRGRWIFHIDPDDTMPPGSLQALVDAARAYASDIVRGAFIHEQLLLGKASNSTRKGLPPGNPPQVNLVLRDRPDLLHTTEGHWANLYRAEFAKRVFYPEDLKMGQDSIFLTHAYIKARSITLISDLVYNYRANPKSAMNVFNFRKYIDEIEWRHRSWKALSAAGLQDLGSHLLCDYWNPAALEAFDTAIPADQKRLFFRKLKFAFLEAGNSDLSKTKNHKIKLYFSDEFKKISSIQTSSSLIDIDANIVKRLRIAVLSTFDSGGAGIAALRSVEGLRAAGHDARLYCLINKSNIDFVWQLPVHGVFHAESFNSEDLRKIWRIHAVLTHDEVPQINAREMISKIGSLPDLGVLKAICAEADIVHLHWTSGMIDYDRLPEVIGDTPVVWTLHDMMPLTGGCHYSEGCDRFRESCSPCPLVSGAIDLPQRALEKKIRAIAALPYLAVITPSAWLTQLAESSRVFHGRKVQTIPNLFPAKAFQPIPRIIARHRLGLPLDKKLIVFGADSLTNKRKGADILAKSILRLRSMGKIDGVEAVVFGANSIDLGVKCHAMGQISNNEELSLIYASGDVFAFPSREDNAPQTVLESLLSGTPVAAFSVGFVPDLICHKETGYIVQCEDANDFADGIAWLLQKSKSQEQISMAVRCHLTAKKYNSPDFVLASYVNVFQEAAYSRK